MTEDPFAPGASTQKREARERAIELLYEAEVRGISISDVLSSQVIAPAQLVEDLVRGVSEDIEGIDAEIDAYLNDDWSLDRLGMLDLWILRAHRRHREGTRLAPQSLLEPLLEPRNSYY